MSSCQNGRPSVRKLKTVVTNLEKWEHPCPTLNIATFKYTLNICKIVLHFKTEKVVRYRVYFTYLNICIGIHKQPSFCGWDTIPICMYFCYKLQQVICCRYLK